MKKCNKCNVEKSLDNFYKHDACAQGVAHHCKDCEGKRASRSARKRKYNLTDDELDVLLSVTHCPGCNEELTEGTNYRGRVIDHDHTTGRVRGALCRECNLIIGYAKDNSTILFNLIKYLKNVDTIRRA